jgi:murein tripeptide amidase MpaA
LDLWTNIRLGPVDLRVPKASLETVQEELLRQIPHQILIQDLESLIEREQDYSEKIARHGRRKHRKPDPEAFFKDYQDLADIQKFFRALPHVTEVSIGNSYLEAPIYAYKFGNGSRSIVLHGGIHAREWISVATVSFIGYKLATSEEDSDLRQLFTFHVIPVLNVDGYEHTRSGDSKARLWRKNRQVNDNSPCLGVDINRNFDYAWNQGGGASTRPCADDFKGPHAFSTPEALAIASYLKKVHRPISYIDFHA